MTQEEKNLLLTDISARIPYGVKVEVDFYDENGDVYHKGLGTIYQINKDGYFYIEEDDEERNIDCCLPYLYPLQNIYNLIEKHQEEYDEIVKSEIDDVSSDEVSVNGFIQMQHFYHKYHVDYRGLINVGLANDITKLNTI